MKRFLITIISIVALFSVSLGQTSETFDGAVADTLPAVQKFIGMGGNRIPPTAQGIGRDGSGNAVPYNSSGDGYWGYAYYDSSLAGDWEFGVRVGALSGAFSTDLVLFWDDDESFVTGGGYQVRFQPVSGTANDILRAGEHNQYTGDSLTQQKNIALFNSNVNYPSAAMTITEDIVVGDTIFIRFWDEAVDVITFGKKNGANVDTVAMNFTLETSWNIPATTTGRVGFGIKNRTASELKVSDFYIKAATTGGTPPPVDTDDFAPVISTISATKLSAYLGDMVILSALATDDSVLGTGYFEVDTIGAYNVVAGSTAPTGAQTHTYSMSTGFTRYTAGTATGRFRVGDRNKNDAAVRYDTSTTITVTFSAPPVGTGYNKVSYGYLSYAGSIKWTPTTSGTVPVDSIPFDVLTHAVIWAGGGEVPVPNGYLTDIQRGVPIIHQKGCYAGFGYGGSSDAALVAMIAGGPTAWLPWINYNLTLVDLYGVDFFEFDIESAANPSDVYGLFSQFYDSLQTRTSTFNPAIAPFIVLTMGPQPLAAMASVEPFVAFCPLMSYDYIGTWWGRLTADTQVRSRVNWNGNVSGGYTDYYSAAGSNAEARSMQWGVERASTAGWPKEKLLVGFDVNPTYYTATAGDPLYLGKPYTGITGLSASASSSPDFSVEWSTMSQWNPDSLIYDADRGVYTIRTTGPGGQLRLYMLMTYPGKDQAVAATRKVIDSMDVGGVMWWNLTTELWNIPASVPVQPVGGRNFFYNQMRTHFGDFQRDTTVPVLNPPRTFSPLNGAMSVNANPTLNWEDIATASKYWVQVTTAPTTFPLVLSINDSTLVVSQKATTIAVGTGVQSWRVAVRNAAGIWGDFSSWQQFLMDPAVPTTPTLVSPANNATGQSTTGTILTWNSIQTATNYAASYRLEVAIDSPMVTFILQDSSFLMYDTTKLLSFAGGYGLSSGTKHYWRVRGKNETGIGNWSVIRNFTTASVVTPPLPPALNVPYGSAIGVDTVSVVFDWSNSNTASSYQIQIEKYTGGAWAIVKDTTLDVSVYTLWNLDGNTAYQWKVRAINSAGAGSWTFDRWFTTAVKGTPTDPAAPWYSVYHNNPVSGKWDGIGPVDYVDWAEVDSGFASTYYPEDSSVHRMSRFGIANLRDGWRPFGAAAAAASDTTQNLVADTATVLGSLKIVVQDASGAYRTLEILPNASLGDTRVYGPNKGGTLATTVGDRIDALSLTSNTPIPASSGALGFTPAQADDGGAGNALWGTQVGNRTDYALYTLSNLRGEPFYFVDYEGVTGTKRLMFRNGRPAWEDTIATAAGGWVNDTNNDTTKAYFVITKADGTVVGRIYAGTSNLTIESAAWANGVTISDAAGTGNYIEMSGAKGQTYQSGNVTTSGELTNFTVQSTTLAAAATTFAVTSNVITLDGDAGGNTVGTITGAAGKGLYTIIFVDASVTITDTDAHTANTVDLAGTATNLTSADDLVLQLLFDGTSWYEVSRSAN